MSDLAAATAAVAALHRRGASVAFEDRDGVRVTLAETSDPVAAEERCSPASAAVAAELAADPALAGWSIGWAYYECFHANHEVTVLARGGVEVVVDFTARQFEAGAEHPLVLPIEAYEEWLGGRSDAGAIGSRDRGED